MSETSDTIRQRVQVARNIQQTRFANSNSQGSKTESSNIVSNADMRIAEIRQFCKLQDEGGALSGSKCQSLMRAAMSQLNLSARGYHRVLKLARTIADLAGSEEVQSVHSADALQYRPKLMMG